MAAIHCDELTEMCRDALLSVGVAARDARVLAEATVEAEALGNRAVGVAHLFDYLDGYRKGRISTAEQPVVHRVAPAAIDVDARDGLAQVAFTEALYDFQDAVRECGIATLWIRSSFTCGELGYYVRRLARSGNIIALASANSPALMSLGGAGRSILGTNPLAYGIPRPGMQPVVIDQASSATAFVNIRRAAEAGESIPAGWALDSEGQSTQDPRAALEGTLLPFGGHRGGNVALLIEVLATLSGGSFSLDAAPFDSGSASPGIGVFILGINSANFPGSADRLSRHLEHLRHDQHVHLPALELDETPTSIEVSAELLDRLRNAKPAGS
ncbi:Ldh family oxidoreductase [Parasphingorhabdus pacifica]